MVKSKSGVKFDRYRKNRPMDIMTTIFLLFVVSIYSVYFDNKYFNVTVTRATVFTEGAIFFTVLFIAALCLEIALVKYYDKKARLFYTDKPVASMPEVWMLSFILANVMSYILCESEIRETAFSGESGRYFGLGLVLILGLTFILLSYEAYISKLVFYVLAAISSFAIIMADMQHFGADPFGLKETMVEKQKQLFISTFGNINTYGSYLCMVLSLMAGVFIFAKRLSDKIISGIVLLILSTGIIPAKSDNVYLGVFAAFMVLLYVAIHNRRALEFVMCCTIICIGMLGMAVNNVINSGSQKHINGIAEIIESPVIMAAATTVMVILLIGLIILKRKNTELYTGMQNRRFMLIMTATIIIFAVGFVVVGVKKGMSMFTFDYTWGTYRGYVWAKSVELFRMGSLKQKLFGYGNESTGYYMSKYFYDEMIEVTNRKYDNSHNELLQYLVTTGLFGMLSYIGVFVTGVRYIAKRMKDDAAAIALLATAVAYAAQGLVNLNQPITTPYYFVVLAAGIGYVRYRERERRYHGEDFRKG